MTRNRIAGALASEPTLSLVTPVFSIASARTPHGRMVVRGWVRNGTTHLVTSASAPADNDVALVRDPDGTGDLTEYGVYTRPQSLRDDQLDRIMTALYEADGFDDTESDTYGRPYATPVVPCPPASRWPRLARCWRTLTRALRRAETRRA